MTLRSNKKQSNPELIGNIRISFAFIARRFSGGRRFPDANLNYLQSEKHSLYCRPSPCIRC